MMLFFFCFGQDMDCYNISYSPLDQYDDTRETRWYDHGVRRTHWPAKLQLTTGPEKRSRVPSSNQSRVRHERTNPRPFYLFIPRPTLAYKAQEGDALRQVLEYPEMAVTLSSLVVQRSRGLAGRDGAGGVVGM